MTIAGISNYTKYIPLWSNERLVDLSWLEGFSRWELVTILAQLYWQHFFLNFLLPITVGGRKILICLLMIFGRRFCKMISLYCFHKLTGWPDFSTYMSILHAGIPTHNSQCARCANSPGLCCSKAKKSTYKLFILFLFFMHTTHTLSSLPKNEHWQFTKLLNETCSAFRCIKLANYYQNNISHF